MCLILQASKEVLLRCDAAVKRAEKDTVGACAAATARHLDNESEAAAIKLQVLFSGLLTK